MDVSRRTESGDAPGRQVAASDAGGGFGRGVDALGAMPSTHLPHVGRLLALSCWLVTGCAAPDTGSTAYTFGGATMGTSFTVTVVDEGLTDARRARLRTVVEAELDDVDEKMSHYDEQSELSRFNRARTTEPVRVSAATFAVFEHAWELSERTGGAFDVTVGPLVEAWGFGPSSREEVPSQTEIAQVLARVGYQSLELDPRKQTLRKRIPELACDLSAIAKGFGVDRAAAALEAEGVDRYMIEVGGDLRVAGLNDREMPWRIAIERPVVDHRGLHMVVPLQGMAIATSGDYRNFRQVGGRRWSHTIDPRTGLPVEHDVASVSVIDALCVRADGLATALSVLGPDEGLQFAIEHDIPALLLVRAEDGGLEELMTPAFRRVMAGEPIDLGPTRP